MSTLPTILIIDDEVLGLETLKRNLAEDFDVHTALTIAEATDILEREWVRIVLCDQRMPEITGVEFLKQVREQWPEVIRMIISGYTESEDIISAINEAGIYQYITKPWHPDNLILLLNNANQLFDLQRQNEALSVELKMTPAELEKQLADKHKNLRKNARDNDGIVRTENSSMNQICEKIRQIAPYDVSVLLAGESGTGKELAARALHQNSGRWDKPFVVENCGALPDELLESELFGYKRGAFTGAVEDRTGLFERANGGTVFLDEIGEVSPAFQVKLLRVLQEGEIRPLGSGRTRKVDVRIIAASNKNLTAEMQADRFREDLYYRLATVTIHLPPLRERKADIPIIANSLLRTSTENFSKPCNGFSKEALTCMQAYHWPGNVRELQNEIHHMLIMSDQESLDAKLLSPHILRAVPQDESQPLEHFSNLKGDLKQRVESLESCILRETLIRHSWNKSRSAKELGLSRVGLRNKLERYGLQQLDQLMKPASSSDYHHDE